MMIDHVSIGVKDFYKSLEFYDQTFSILGYSRLMSTEHFAHYGTNEHPSFIISDKGNEQEKIGQARGVHIAFSAPNRIVVEEWHARALELGGINNGDPKLRPEYSPTYYSAYIIDPNGWRLEAVCWE